MVLNIDNQMRTILLVKSSKCAFYFDSISKGSVKQEFQERIQFIISVNQTTLGQNWQHLHTDTHHQDFEEHCILLPLLNIECILRGISFLDVSPTVQKLRYRYAKMLVAAHPHLASEPDPLLKRYLSVERISINLEAFERDVEWRKAARQSVGESRIKDEFEDKDDYDGDNTPWNVTQFFAPYPSLSPTPVVPESEARTIQKPLTGPKAVQLILRDNHQLQLGRVEVRLRNKPRGLYITKIV
ncbi:hypothetical protein IFR05_003365 [Cadophora sp. M221]|nr:hypothetical protein IFR05_003365 [Cadophora sp. M221]